MYEGERYYTTKEQLKETLNKYGVDIIPSIINESECEILYSGIWDFFEHITKYWEIPVNRNDVTTYREFYKLYPLHSMLIQYFSIGHAQVSWDMRQNEKILDIFSYFWGCDNKDLLVSFDGLSLHLPPEITKKGWLGKSWFHTDQNIKHNNFECVQSFITALDINEGDATLTFMENSHSFHNILNVEGSNPKTDWYKLNKEEEQMFLNKGCEYKKIKAPKGSLIFWDSRTIHSGCEAMKGRSTMNFRAIVYLSYSPRSQCNNKNIEKKKKAYNELRTTNHWACNPKLFPKTPRTYGGVLPTINPINNPVLNSIGLKLVGF